MRPWTSPKLLQAAGDSDYLPRVPGLSAEPGRRGSTGSARGSGAHAHPHAHAGPSTALPSLVALMRMSREDWDLWTRGSAIRRAGYAGFRRTVAVGLGNWLAGLDQPPEEAVALLREALEDDEPLVREHAAWALERTKCASDRT